MAGGGVQRWLKFTKHLPQFGWNPIIFTPESPSFSLIDESLTEEISENLEVVQFPIWEPYSLVGKKARKQGIVNESSKRDWKVGLLTWLRGNLLIPDPKVFWVKPSVKFLKSFIKDRDIEVIITTGPPHSMHLIGQKLKKVLDIKWIADFRDPWSHWDILSELRVSSIARKYHKRLERKVLMDADEVITVSRNWADVFESDYSRKVNVITNGFDADDFEIQNIRPAQDKFRIIHAGLLNSFRNSVSFWKAIEELAAQDTQFRNKVSIILSGIIDQRIKEQIESNEVLNDLVTIKEYIPHNELIEEYLKSSVLLVLTNNTENQAGHIPGKLFEYLASNRFIVMLGNTNGDAAQIVGETGSGYCVEPDDLEEIKSVLELLFERFKNDETPDQTDINKYSRENLTSKLADILNSL